MDKAAAAPPVSPLEWAALATGVVLWLIILRLRGRSQHRALLAALVILACVLTSVAIGAILTTHRPALAELTNQPWFILPMVVLSVLAFIAKQRIGTLYGASEIVVALLMFWFSQRAHNDSLLVKGLALSAGLYVFVRGMETMRNALRRG